VSGVYLFWTTSKGLLSDYRFNRPMHEVWKSIIPLFLVLLAGVLMITYVPFMSTALPELFR